MVNRAKRYALPTVTRALIPVLIRATSTTADGYTLADDMGKRTFVRIVPADAVQGALLDHNQRQRADIERRFGRVSPAEWTDLRQLNWLLNALRFSNPTAIETALEKFLEQFKGNSEQRQLREYIDIAASRQGNRERAINFLLRWTASGNAYVQFCIWMEGAVPKVGLLAVSLGQAIAVHILLQLLSYGGVDVGVCKRCGRAFRRIGGDKNKYCTLACGNAARQADYRERHGKKTTTEFYPMLTPIKIDAATARRFAEILKGSGKPKSLYKN